MKGVCVCVFDRMTVVACYIGGQFYKSIPKYDSLPPQVASLAIQAISINSAYTSRILVKKKKIIIYIFSLSILLQSPRLVKPANGRGLSLSKYFSNHCFKWKMFHFNICCKTKKKWHENSRFTCVVCLTA